MALSQAALELLITLKDEASKGLDSLGGALSSVGAVAGGAALAGVVALGAGIKGGVEDAMGARALFASTEQTIKTMGNAAGVSAEHVVEMASALSDASGKSLFGDDQIQSSTNLLLTFGEIKGATLDAATALTVDLAQALGGAPRDQAMMLGKALNDPINGMSALGKAGLTFSEAQKEQIKVMQESGDMAGAQAIIIAELNKQVGGQAEAAAQAAGGIVQFQAGLGETFETIGAELLPVLDQLGAWLTAPETQKAISIFATSLATGIRIAANFLVNDLIPAVTAFANFMAPIVIPMIQNVVKYMQEWGKTIDDAVKGWGVMKQVLSDFKTGYIDPIIRGWEYISRAIADANEWFKRVGDSIQRIQIPGWLQGHSPPPLANWFSDIATSAEQAGGAVADVAPPGGAVPSSLMAGGASGGTVISGAITIIVQGSADIQATALAVREELNKLSRRNAGNGLV